MSDQRILRYQVVLMESPGLIITPCEVFNPATLLPTARALSPFHHTIEALNHWTKPLEGLPEDPLTNLEEIWYTDGSSLVLDGKTRARYAVVSNFKMIEAKSLPPGTSAQLAELIALTRAFSQVSSVAQSCPTLCDPMDCSTPGLPVHHQLPEAIQTHVH